MKEKCFYCQHVHGKYKDIPDAIYCVDTETGLGQCQEAGWIYIENELKMQDDLVTVLLDRIRHLEHQMEL